MNNYGNTNIAAIKEMSQKGSASSEIFLNDSKRGFGEEALWS